MVSNKRITIYAYFAQKTEKTIFLVARKIKACCAVCPLVGEKSRCTLRDVYVCLFAAVCFCIEPVGADGDGIAS